MTDLPIVSVLIHVPDWRTATDWYAQAFPAARRVVHAPDDFGHLQLGAVALEIVNADAKVTAGAAGSVVYWRVADLDGERARLLALGAEPWRGPLALPEGGRMCQVRDPWGNCIGLRED